MKNPIFRTLCALITLAAATFVSGCAPTSSTRSVAAPTKPPSNTAKKVAPIAWKSSYPTAWEAAYVAKKPLMIDFYADWCQPCKLMDANTYPDAAVARESSQFTNVKVNIDKEQELAQKYKVSGIPNVIWVDNRGQIIHSAVGYLSPSEMVQEMRIARSKFTPIS